MNNEKELDLLKAKCIELINLGFYRAALDCLAAVISLKEVNKSMPF